MNISSCRPQHGPVPSGRGGRALAIAVRDQFYKVRTPRRYTKPGRPCILYSPAGEVINATLNKARRAFFPIETFPAAVQPGHFQQAIPASGTWGFLAIPIARIYTISPRPILDEPASTLRSEDAHDPSLAFSLVRPGPAASVLPRLFPPRQARESPGQPCRTPPFPDVAVAPSLATLRRSPSRLSLARPAPRRPLTLRIACGQRRSASRPAHLSQSAHPSGRSPGATSLTLRSPLLASHLPPRPSSPLLRR